MEVDIIKLECGEGGWGGGQAWSSGLLGVTAMVGKSLGVSGGTRMRRLAACVTGFISCVNGMLPSSVGTGVSRLTRGRSDPLSGIVCRAVRGGRILTGRLGEPDYRSAKMLRF